MKDSPVEIVLSLVGTVFGMLAVFHKPLGLSAGWQLPLLIAAAVCWIPVITLQRRRRNARLAAGLPASEKPPTKRGFWLFVTAGFVLCVAGAFLGPYLVENLSFSRSVISSIITFIAWVIALFVRRRQRP